MKTNLLESNRRSSRSNFLTCRTYLDKDEKRKSSHENDDNQKNHVLHDAHDDGDNHDIVDDDENGNQVHEDIKYVHTIEERKTVFDCLSSLRQ